jgi:hypothetical protein
MSNSLKKAPLVDYTTSGNSFAGAGWSVMFTMTAAGAQKR